MAEFLRFFNNIYLAFLNIIYPKHCHNCDKKLHYKNNLYLCKKCIKLIPINTPPFCEKCGKTIPALPGSSLFCLDCINKKQYFNKIFSCCRYEGLLKELLHKFKYRNLKYLSFLFSWIMLKFIKLNVDLKQINSIIYVPASAKMLNLRGFDQSYILAKKLSVKLGIPLIKNVFKRKKNIKQQTILNRKERFKNIKNAFILNNFNSKKNKNIMLIDDVITTSATVNECSKLLKRNGCEQVLIVTLARG